MSKSTELMTKDGDLRTKDSALFALERAKRIIENADEPETVAQGKAWAAVVAEYARINHLGQEVANAAMALTLRCVRRLGAMSLRLRPDRDHRRASQLPSETAQANDVIRQALGAGGAYHRARRLAQIPDEAFEKGLAARTSRGDLTRNAFAEELGLSWSGSQNYVPHGLRGGPEKRLRWHARYTCTRMGTLLAELSLSDSALAKEAAGVRQLVEEVQARLEALAEDIKRSGL